MNAFSSRRVRLLPLAVVVGAFAFPLSAPAEDRGDVLALNSRGLSKNMSSSPNRTVYEFELYDLATGERTGSVHDDIFCSTTTPPPCAVFDALTTFRLPGGEFTNHAQVSVAPDSQRPGYFLVAADGVTDSIVAASGIYAGRTGKVRLRGHDDGREYPNTLGADDLWSVRFNPR
jgi:hypothetical protein